MSTRRTLVTGVLSPFAAAAFGLGTYLALTRTSRDVDADFLFRLSATALAMAVPFGITVVLAIMDGRRGAFGGASRIGLGLAFVSLALVWLPLRGAIQRANLLTVEGNVPDIYSVTARYPANFLIDRDGRLQPAPSSEQPFENLVAKVDELLGRAELARD